ncbi:hypothetical protein BDB00DRAFT_869967 [Zychaea mexicana]|uniref:uncharacterized protein n=1 Tax=Zychaea mexicana TaxID=64656 RepID=UPI0022FE0010|nr:uncharacterized protein BDB00DRAFT_869967 [Zychaea mexicana]KAI9496065.1 hypothetical protein BDB00DRAFT_869967 [Zychaea mexicana]
MNQPARGSRVVFVGNIPFELTEEQLIDIFKEVGPVASFRLLFDRETGRPKGYGFCEFYDAETAASAVRNLNDYDIGGRQIRVDYAAMDPHLDNQRHHKQHQQQQQQQPPQPPRSGPPPPQAQAPQQPPPPMMGQPPGMPPKPPGSGTSVDEISKVLASMSSQDLFTLMTHMKQMSFDRPGFTREFLGSNPQVAYALFQAMVMMNIVDPNIITRIMSNPTGATQSPVAPPSAPTQPVPQPMQPPMPMPQQQQPQQPQPLPQPPQQQQQQQHQQPQHLPPQMAPQMTPQMPFMAPMGGAAAAMGAALGGDVKEQQKALLMQVLQLTDEQINALGPEHRDQIRQLKAQLMQQPR